MGIFPTLTETNVRELALAIARNEPTTIEDLPLYSEAMRNHDMRHEVFSLVPTRLTSNLLAMTAAEVRAMSEPHGPLRAGSYVPGRAGPSVFGSIFGA